MFEKQQKLLSDQQSEKERELAKIKKEKTLEEERLKEKLRESLNEAEVTARLDSQIEFINR